MGATNGPVVVARDLTRRYGEGEAVVEALRGVDIAGTDITTLGDSALTRPTVLFADEATGNLDSSTSAEILELLRRSVEECGQTIVMVTHDARAAAVAHRVLLLADGELVRELGQSNQHEILPVMEEVAAP